jgi:hypothetical protein
MVDTPIPGDAPQRIKFHYIKGQHFRVVHVDGLIGGVTPRGLIHMAVYSERPAIPQVTEHALSETGMLGDIASQEGKEGIVREIDVDLMITRTTAIEFRDWLTERINDMDTYIAAAQANQPAPRPR